MKEERRVDEFFYPPSVSRPMATFLLFLCIQNKMRVYFEGDYNDGFFLEIKWSNQIELFGTEEIFLDFLSNFGMYFCL